VIQLETTLGRSAEMLFPVRRFPERRCAVLTPRVPVCPPGPLFFAADLAPEASTAQKVRSHSLSARLTLPALGDSFVTLAVGRQSRF
jgi:hypothetical protein